MAKTEKKAAGKTKAKPKVTKNKKPKAHKKLVAKPKSHTKPTAKPKTHAKKASIAKTKSSTINFSEPQKIELLSWIEKIVDLHKRKKAGLKSLTAIDAILNKYNQRYTHPDEKFDAIAKIGMERDQRVANHFFYVNVEGRDKDINDLYILLADTMHGKTDFSETKQKLKSIYEKALG